MGFFNACETRLCSLLSRTDFNDLECSFYPYVEGFTAVGKSHVLELDEFFSFISPDRFMVEKFLVCDTGSSCSLLKAYKRPLFSVLHRGTRPRLCFVSDSKVNFQRRRPSNNSNAQITIFTNVL